MAPSATLDAENPSRPNVRVRIETQNSTPPREGPTVWLPWCVAPLWVFLPIFGCLVAGAVRRPAVASGSLEPPVTIRAEQPPVRFEPAPSVRLATIQPR